MRIRVLLFRVGVILFAMTFVPMGDQSHALDITKVMQGIVRDIKANTIKIEKDPDGDQVRFNVNTNTIYDNVQNWKEMKVGDRAQIEYQTDHNDNIAITITKIEVEN